MDRKVQRKKDDRLKIPYYKYGITHLYRDYKTLYPQGAYAKALIISICLTGLTSLIFVYVFFVLLPGSVHK